MVYKLAHVSHPCVLRAGLLMGNKNKNSIKYNIKLEPDWPKIKFGPIKIFAGNVTNRKMLFLMMPFCIRSVHMVSTYYWVLKAVLASARFVMRITGRDGGRECKLMAISLVIMLTWYHLLIRPNPGW